MDTFNYDSLRAREARFSKIFKPLAVRLLIILVILINTSSFVYLVWFAHNALGWICLAIAIAGVMFYTWLVNEAIPVPVGKTQDINDLLSANVLRLLGRDTTPQQLAAQLYRTRSGDFLALRFGIAPQSLERLAADLGPDLTPILATAREIWRTVDGETISGGMIAIAIIQNHPRHEMLLKRARLELSDLYAGIIWYNYLHGLVKSAREHRRDGGIARDFTFGYTPTLQHFGTNISEQRSRVYKAQIRMSAQQETLSRMVNIFSEQGRQNVALIGPEGSGRTTTVAAFADLIMDADTKIPNSLKYRQVFMLNSSALISAAHGEEGRLESLVTRIINEAYAAKNIILCLDNAQLFFEQGTGKVDISNILLPVLEAGNLRMILIMNEQKFLEISAKNSSLTNVLNKIMIPPANRTETIKVMQDRAPILEAKYNVICTYWALQESYRLSERYIHDLEMPGRALNLLEAACNYAEDGFVTDFSVQQAIEKTKGVKVQAAASETERARLLQLEDLIHERMIDQEAAVSTVANALRRAAAGVRNEKRPIGTFLFLGPTGVGKTELAKALSEVYFQGEDNIVRVDLNEYVTAGDVARLIAEGAENSTSLTAQVMKHPFCVVLLDEIEKAHPQVLTTLLQMLDEGVLRDVKNREVSFRDTIVIATSNAGANQIREYVSEGRDLEHLKPELINMMVNDGQFKPEFLNRFDEICIFKPLSKADLLKIVDLIIKSINQTLAPQKITVTLSDGAKRLLVERGYDPQMGARPMRRIVQKTVEDLVAKLVLSGNLSSGGTLHITEEMI